MSPLDQSLQMTDADAAPSDDYISEHFDTNQRSLLLPTDDMNKAQSIYSSSEKPKSSHPMSVSRKISAFVITISHIFTLIAIHDMFFVADTTKAMRWFLGTIILYSFTGVQGITAGAHRLWAHRSYKAAWPVRLWLVCMNSIANQSSIITWCTEHRIHHLHVDTDADPHNINRGFFFAHMGWLYSARTDAYAEARKTIDISDLHADPIVKFQHIYYPFIAIVFCYILPTLLGAHFGGGDVWRGFIYLGNLRWVMTLHATWNVNSLAHMYGNRPYDSDQKATEHVFTSILSGGEGWHNFHHTLSTDYRACEQESLWKFNDPSGIDWRFNLARFWIDFYAALGGVSDRRVLRVPHRNSH